MKMVPTAAVDILLGLLPLSVMNVAQAQAGIYRLMCSQQWTPKLTNFCHNKKSWEIECEPNLQTGNERIIPRSTYQTPFTAKFSEKCE
jgi:Tfp pilus assembly protein PilV